MANRRVHTTEGDDGAALEVNAIRADVASLRTQLLSIGTKLDADALTQNDYNSTIAANLGTQGAAELARPPYTNGTEVGGKLDLDGKRVYHEDHDGAVILEQVANRADLDTLRVAFNALLTKLDADVIVADSDYNALHAVSALASVDVVSGEQLAGEPAQVNSAGARVHSTDGDDALVIEIENMAADITSIRNAMIGMLQKLDLDGGVPLTDYESTNTPAAETGFGTRRASSSTVTGLPGLTGPVVVPQPAGDPAL